MLAARRLSASTSPLLLRRLSVQTHPTALPPPPPPEATESGPGAWARRVAALSLLGLTGAVAASAVSDLSIFLSCSSQAIEKATQNQQIVNAIGKPIVRGPWYSASIAVNHARHSVSCTFPVSAPQGSGLLKFKAVRLGDESWYSFLQPSDWEILIMDAILDIHTEDGKHRTMRVTIPDNTPAPPPADCTACKSHTAPPPPPSPPSAEK
ncbi:hypothetical protein SEVIR_7G038500v4 [Setaria viridis]|uniref:Uncharacterized protein n=1 Tax=Setaria viridis TaxID=4556 RepID=A0A4V6D3L1_SETVI|nr:uncharacterized protein LOC117862776 [Setaria viridis]TKW03066.1 hypothetical protein SEVIR_7G038500v2 [Setaria viridis]